MDVSQAVEKLKSSEASVRTAAAEQLAHLEEAAQPAAVPLVRATTDSEESVRQWASEALESLGPPAAGDASALGKLLADPHLDVAYWAAMLLGRLQTDAAACVPQIVTALQSHPETTVREQAAWALGKIGPGATAALGALQKLATDPDARLARLAKQAIEQISSK
ncbi:MAG TPA: HEAT repeat domain-containing protein [Pirellulales bacterium]|jgi:HEAT repeat protein|nr:HEAT repeat domain-containing protein [Pirellulales bacterium]